MDHATPGYGRQPVSFRDFSTYIASLFGILAFDSYDRSVYFQSYCDHFLFITLRKEKNK
jgi:hypothetical protein